MARALATREQRIKRRKRLRRKTIGVVFLLFAVIGAGFIISLIIGRVNVALDDTDEKRDYEILFSALVSMDPADFSSILNADPKKLKEAAILTTIEMENLFKYESDEFGYTYIPTTDIDRYTIKLFGPNIQLENATFGQQGLIAPGGDGIDYTGYLYIPEREAYLVPPTSSAGGYFPRVDAITRRGNTKILTIAYMQLPDSQTQTSSIMGTVEPVIVKYREYVLLKDGKDFYLYSIRIPESQQA
ncbi:MAG: hypothetical protein FWG21_00125 [Oscillospiraceae bacterium]|nr:hypothetical protein [Oscillospiraceae bacterium]